MQMKELDLQSTLHKIQEKGRRLACRLRIKLYWEFRYWLWQPHCLERWVFRCPGYANDKWGKPCGFWARYNEFICSIQWTRQIAYNSRVVTREKEELKKNIPVECNISYGFIWIAEGVKIREKGQSIFFFIWKCKIAKPNILKKTIDGTNAMHFCWYFIRMSFDVLPFYVFPFIHFFFILVPL